MRLLMRAGARENIYAFELASYYHNTQKMCLSFLFLGYFDPINKVPVRLATVSCPLQRTLAHSRI